MRTTTLRLLAAASLAAGVLATPAAAIAHPAGSDRWDGEYVSRDVSQIPVITGESVVPIERQSDNVEFVAHVPVAATSDMQFQRREGPQRLRGEIIDERLDIVVLGGTATPGMSIIDITDPTNPVVLSTVSCGGFHSDVAVYENYALQTWDGGNRPCAPDEPANRTGVESVLNQDEKGVRIYDITDPADPILIEFYHSEHGIPAGVHNVTINGDAGLAYLNMAEFNADDPPWGYVDLTDPELPITIKSIRDWSPSAGDGCHDQGLAPERGLLACAGITASYIWDISDPTTPVEVAAIPNPGINIHHGSRFTPDEQTLVLGDELAGAAAATPCLGAGTPSSPIGAAWFYDTAVPEAPVLNGVFSTPDTDGDYCTTHFYGFHEGSTLMPMGMYDAGIEIVDYAAVAEGVPGTPSSYAHFEPRESGFFSAYAWHGYVYGSSFEYGTEGRNTDAEGRGLWIIEVDGIEDVEPTAVDEGNGWGRWTPEVSGVHVTMAARVGLAPAEAHTNAPLYAVALAGALTVGAAVRRRREGRAARLDTAG